VEIVYERVAAIDVGKKIIAVAVRTPGEKAGKRRQQVRKYNTYHATLAGMVAWLVSEGVTHVTMEATGIYWKPIFHALCEAERPLEVLLVNARHVKNVPGRKSDALDAVWLAELTECGLLRGSFIPPPQIAAIRELTRYRKKLVEQRASELQRLAKVLEDAGIKIDSVASTLITVSAREMIEALINGERDPAVLADLARGVMRKKIPELRMACAGRFGDQHALMCTLHLEHIDHLTDMIARLDTRIDEACLPFDPQIQLLATIPGIGERAAQVIISEIGVEMVRFPPRRTWRRGPGCARATTNPPGGTARARRARATPSSARSSPSAPGPPGAPAPMSAPSSAAFTAGSARRADARPPSPPPTP
jgi:transposase